jgi:hypothetical protein
MRRGSADIAVKTRSTVSVSPGASGRRHTAGNPDSSPVSGAHEHAGDGRRDDPALES